MTDCLSIVVPVYNERDTIAAVIDRLTTIDLPVPREIIVVDDGSRDGTRQILAARPPSPEVSVVLCDTNRGKGHAVRMGIARASGTIVAIQDADLELDPAQLAELVDPILRGEARVVYGSRFLEGRGATPFVGYAANRLLTTLTNVLFGGSLTDMETCYKVMHTEIARSLRLEADRYDIEPEITARVLQAGHRIVERPVRFSPRSRAAGKKIGWRDGHAAVRAIFRYWRSDGRPRRD